VTIRLPNHFLTSTVKTPVSNFFRVRISQKGLSFRWIVQKFATFSEKLHVQAPSKFFLKHPATFEKFLKSSRFFEISSELSSFYEFKIPTKTWKLVTVKI